MITKTPEIRLASKIIRKELIKRIIDEKGELDDKWLDDTARKIIVALNFLSGVRLKNPIRGGNSDA